MLTVTDGVIGEENAIKQSLLILVEDVNDNAPIFENGDHPLILAVSSDTAVGHPVTTLRVTIFL